MKFDELHAMIPYAHGGKEKLLAYSPYPGRVTLALPGRHAAETTPPGGDFVVMVHDDGMRWRAHQFTHVDIFKDVETKRDDTNMGFFMNAYLDVVSHYDPLKYSPGDGVTMPGIEFTTFLCAAQCLALAEHRRYARYESKFGGRFLPFRFAAGIAEGLWTATDAAEKQKKGRPGVEWLEKDFGVPVLTKGLME